MLLNRNRRGIWAGGDNTQSYQRLAVVNTVFTSANQTDAAEPAKILDRSYSQQQYLENCGQ